MGLDKKIWGPALWTVIHSVALNYPDDTNDNLVKYKHREFIVNLQYIIPCNKCRNNYKRNLKIHPLTDEDLKSSSSFFLWTLKLHNIVNMELGKPILTEKKLLEIMLNNSKHKKKTDTDNFLYGLVRSIMGGIFGALIGAIVIHKYNKYAGQAANIDKTNIKMNNKIKT
jgi:hypothetical protein